MFFIPHICSTYSIAIVIVSQGCRLVSQEYRLEVGSKWNREVVLKIPSTTYEMENLMQSNRFNFQIKFNSKQKPRLDPNFSVNVARIEKLFVCISADQREKKHRSVRSTWITFWLSYVVVCINCLHSHRFFLLLNPLLPPPSPFFPITSSFASSWTSLHIQLH